MSSPYFRILRPHQWVKNGFVIAPLIFAGKLTDAGAAITAMAAFALFCLASSGTYVFNDIFDAEQDRSHPIKKNRPVASGEIPVRRANLLGAALLLAAVLGSYLVTVAFLWSILAYLLLQFAYNWLLRKVVLLDVLAISAGFVLRAVSGSLAIGVVISPWLILCTLLVALFLALAKRRQELVYLGQSAGSYRKILTQYTVPLLDQLIAIVTAATIVSYAIYTLSPEVTQRLGSKYMVLTLPFVVYGVFRYLYLVHVHEKGGSPTRDLLADRPLLISTFLWGLVSVALIYLH